LNIGLKPVGVGGRFFDFKKGLPGSQEFLGQARVWSADGAKIRLQTEGMGGRWIYTVVWHC